MSRHSTQSEDLSAPSLYLFCLVTGLLATVGFPFVENVVVGNQIFQSITLLNVTIGFVISAALFVGIYTVRSVHAA